jgi:hypothetical protein
MRQYEFWHEVPPLLLQKDDGTVIKIRQSGTQICYGEGRKAQLNIFVATL